MEGSRRRTVVWIAVGLLLAAFVGALYLLYTPLRLGWARQSYLASGDRASLAFLFAHGRDADLAAILPALASEEELEDAWLRRLVPLGREAAPVALARFEGARTRSWRSAALELLQAADPDGLRSLEAARTDPHAFQVLLVSNDWLVRVAGREAVLPLVLALLDDPTQLDTTHSSTEGDTTYTYVPTVGDQALAQLVELAAGPEDMPRVDFYHHPPSHPERSRSGRARFRAWWASGGSDPAAWPALGWVLLRAPTAEADVDVDVVVERPGGRSIFGTNSLSARAPYAIGPLPAGSHTLSLRERGDTTADGAELLAVEVTVAADSTSAVVWEDPP